jgi:hypothetical protein
MKKNLTDKRIDEIMGSLDHIEAATAPDFFYIRLAGKMQPAENRETFFMLRPAFITGMLCLLLTANIVALLKVTKTPKQASTEANSKPAGIESFSDAYQMNTQNLYE